MSSSRPIQWGFICILFAGIGAGRATVENQDPKPDAQQELKQLRAANAGFQARNANLEKRNHDLESQIEKLQLQLAVLRVQKTPPAPAQQPVPENWKRYDFDGMPVYLIPLDTGGAPTTRPARK